MRRVLWACTVAVLLAVAAADDPGPAGARRPLKAPRPPRAARPAAAAAAGAAGAPPPPDYKTSMPGGGGGGEASFPGSTAPADGADLRQRALSASPASPLDVIVVLRSSAVDAEAGGSAPAAGADTFASDMAAAPPAARRRVAAYARLKRRMLAAAAAGAAAAAPDGPAAADAPGGAAPPPPVAASLLAELPHLPVAALRITSAAALVALTSDPAVASVTLDNRHGPSLPESLPIIGQPTTASDGQLGAGCAVAVVDTAGDYRAADLGSCPQPGAGGACRVDAAVDFSGLGYAGDSAHGTNVASIVARVAPAARILMLNVFDSKNEATDSIVLAALDWVAANAANRSICVVNLSLGDTRYNPTPCAASPFEASLQVLKALGVVAVVASGNEALKNGMSSPACAPSAVSVGATFDYGKDINQTCVFTNTAYYLSMMAPGCEITAGGVTLCGTSQAAPHVSGTAAVLRSLSLHLPPPVAVNKVRAALLAGGTPMVDWGSKQTFPLLNLPGAVSALLSDPEVDSSPPSGSVVINGGAGYTNSLDVSLTISASDGASGARRLRMCVDTTSNSSGLCSAAEGFVPFSATSAARLPAGPDGPRQVFVYLQDLAGNQMAQPAAAAITLMTAAPAASADFESGARFTNKRTPSLAITPAAGTGGGSGLWMCVEPAPANGAAGACAGPSAAFVPFASPVPVTLSPGDGLKQVLVTLRDAAGNQSPARANITLDTSPPKALLFAVQGGASAARSPVVALQILGYDDNAAAAGGALTMCVSQSEAACASEAALFAPYATTSVFELRGDDGDKTVHLVLRDAAGNRSPPTAAAIRLTAARFGPSGAGAAPSFSPLVAGAPFSPARARVALAAAAGGAPAPASGQVCVSVRAPGAGGGAPGGGGGAAAAAAGGVCKGWRAVPAQGARLNLLLGTAQGPRVVCAAFRAGPSDTPGDEACTTVFVDSLPPDMTSVKFTAASAAPAAGAAGSAPGAGAGPGPGKAVVRWSPAVAADASGVASYAVTYRPKGGVPPPGCKRGVAGVVMADVPPGPRAESAVLTGLVKGRRYKARLCATDLANNTSPGLLADISAA